MTTFDSCVFCGELNYSPVSHLIDGMYNGFCGNCGLVYLSPKPSDSEISYRYKKFAQYYPDEYLKSEKVDMAKYARERFNLLTNDLELNQKGKVLEVGCAYGHFLRHFLGTGWEAMGVDPSEPEVNFARKVFSLDKIVNGRLEEINFGKGSFNLVAAFHVLEHVSNPRGMLKKMTDLLVPGGRIAIATPCLETLPMDLIDYFFFCQGFHLYTFSQNILKAMMEFCGIEVSRIIHEEKSVFHTSSMLLIGRKKDKPEENPAGRDPIGSRFAQETQIQLNHKHHTFQQKAQGIKKRFEIWAKKGFRVGIYGAGMHTQALLQVCGLGPGEVTRLIDDNSALRGKHLFGVPIENAKSLETLNLDVILVSTLASETQILKRLENSMKNIEILGIYRDLWEGKNPACE